MLLAMSNATLSTPTRRKFLYAVGASAPVILGAENKSGSKNPVLGSGEHTYECIHDWGELPKTISYGNTHGVVEDSQGFIYVHHTVNAASESDDTMVVFDPKGKFVRSWGKDFKGGAHGLHINKEGKEDFLYLCDTKRGVIAKTNLKGEVVWQLGYPEDSEAYKPGADGKKKKWSPTNLAVARNGDVYVGDGYGSSYVLQYDKNGKYIRTIASPGKAPGELSSPHGIAIDSRGGRERLLVADRSNKRLQYFTMDGKHESFAGNVILPCHFSFLKDTLLIPDLDSRVTLLDKDNKLIAHLGEGDAAGSRDLRKKARDQFVPGKFVCPHGAWFDHKGNIFVAEWVEVGRVTKLRKV